MFACMGGRMFMDNFDHRWYSTQRICNTPAYYDFTWDHITDTDVPSVRIFQVVLISLL